MFNFSKIILVLIIVLLLIFTGLSIKFLGTELFVFLKDGKHNYEKIEATIESISLESTSNPNMPEGVFTKDICSISYTYIYNNKKFKSDNIGLNRNIDYSSAFHNKLYKKLNNVNQVIVYVNRDNPKQAVIIKYDLINRKIGSGIITFSFTIFLSLLLYQNFKYPANYISNQIILK
ncbi:DUF3592 domain-containing protein [Zobellia nedashkovskayae]|uniref:DUF3592 domain-containing protein n=1 Tax=Zobellia nedashkovskayae TaxID=2779510 RepID=UPI001889CB14|nr:DUF3592 domain-containing protein [Zobellia nedashkovskayae]